MHANKPGPISGFMTVPKSAFIYFRKDEKDAGEIDITNPMKPIVPPHLLALLGENAIDAVITQFDAGKANGGLINGYFWGVRYDVAER